MSIRYSSIVVSAVLCLLLPALSGCVLPELGASVEVKSAFLKDNELRMVVETSQSSQAFYSHTEKIYNVRHYYVAIDLNAPGSLRNAATIVGPLWIEKDHDWQAEFIPRWHSSSQTHFDQDGRLFKIDWDETHKNWARHQLALESGKAKWIEAGTVIPIPAPTNIFSLNLRTPSGDWQIYLDDNGAASLYDTSNGRKVEDAWLEGAVSKIYSLPSVRKGHRIEDIKLTDDLKYVVYWASQSFEWEGRKYDLTERPYRNTKEMQRSQEHAVIFTRPLTNNVVVEKGYWDDTPFSFPLGYFSINGELCFLKMNTNLVELINQKGEIRFRGKDSGMDPHHYRLQQDSAKGAIVFFDGEILPKHFRMSVWNYEKGTFKTRNFDIYSLFDHYFSSYTPAKRIVPENR